MNQPPLVFIRSRASSAAALAFLLVWAPLRSGAAVHDLEPADGTGNNLAHPAWGSAGADLLRIAPAAYADGVDSPSLPGDLSPRAISNLLNNQADPADPTQNIQTVDAQSLSDFGYAFGQFMDHDLDNTPDGGASFPIPVASGDPIGPDPLPFTRSEIDPNTGVTTPAQQVTVVTSYFDLSQVYGSSQVVADALRTFHGGLLKTSPGNMLPYDNSTYFTSDQIAALAMANDPEEVTTDQLFAAGDVRANENIELTALETLFVRNHNSIASALQARHGDWADEQLYQEARKLNIAIYQNIVYCEWIPAVLGARALPPYRGYRPEVNATISNEFSTVAYRFGHSLVSPGIARESNDGQELEPGIPLAFDFFDPNLLSPSGTVDPLTGLASTDIGPILKADADGNGQAMDLLAINDVRDLLFGNGMTGGQDLIALDLQRGRDHGIPGYNAVRAAFGLPAVTDFSQVPGNQAASAATVQQALQAAYPGGPDTMDAFEAGLSEASVPGSEVGPTFQAILVDQFRRLRDGDRFFYLNEKFNAEENRIIGGGDTLAKVITANTGVTNLQANVMVFHASIHGNVTVSPNGAAGARPKGAAGVTVELKDADGDILATTQTGMSGQYSFNEQSGPCNNPEVTPGLSATGIYSVAIVLPSGMTQTNSAPAAIEVTRGDFTASGVDFLLSSGSASALPAPPRPLHPPIPPRGIRF